METAPFSKRPNVNRFTNAGLALHVGMVVTGKRDFNKTPITEVTR